MAAPRYRSRSDHDVTVEAVQFVLADPTTHWHVNLGHPVAEALQNIHWVQTGDGAAPIDDHDYVVLPVVSGPERPNSTQLVIVKPAEFEATFEPVPDGE